MSRSEVCDAKRDLDKKGRVRRDSSMMTIEQMIWST